jgi:hypothetical protein
MNLWSQPSENSRVLFSSGVSARAGPARGPTVNVRFDADVVVYCDPELLLAAKILLGRLDAHMSKQELDLFNFAANEMTQTSAGPTHVMRREFPKHTP